MNTKRIVLLSIAILAILPFSANADPAAYSGNSPTLASVSAPYQTVTPETHAEEHIASTKYVIGAYNDAIAAINKVSSDIWTEVEEAVSLHNGNIGVDNSVMNATGFIELLNDGETGAYEDTIISAAAVGAGIDYALNKMDNKRVEIYTTWDDDDVAEVPLITASAQQ